MFNFLLKPIHKIVGFILTLLLMVSCSQSGNQAIPSSLKTKDINSNFVSQKQQIPSNWAPIEQIKLVKFESFPIQINVVAYGNLPDECTTISQITEAQTSDRLTLEITTNRQTDRSCSSNVKPFEEIIPLNVAGLSAGIYTVKVNNHDVAFELGIDNLIP
jgi:hypothetical protein